MYSGEYDVCDVTLSVYPHQAGLKNMPGHGGNQTYDLWSTSPSYFKKYSSSKCKQTVCLHYGLDFHFKLHIQTSSQMAKGKIYARR